MPLPLTVSCSSKIQIGFTFLVPAYPGYPGKEAVKWLLLLFVMHDDDVRCLQAMSPDGESIVTGAGDETLRFWNVFNKTRSTKVSFSFL